jgi:hypothetical protein
MFSETINPSCVVARLKMKKPEVVKVLALSGDGDMLVLRKNGEIRSIVCSEDVIKECENVALRN